MKKKLWQNKIYLGLLVCVILFFIFSPQISEAQAGVVSGVLTDFAIKIVKWFGWFLYIFWIFIFGWIANLAMRLLIFTAQFDGFTNVSTVISTWMIVRDIANTFFIFILLLIAFGTILKIETYHWSKMLPKMIIAAVLINFSRTIAGIFVDASQIIMHTFVNAFKDVGSASLTKLFQLGDLAAIGPGGTQGSTTSVDESKFNDLQYVLAMFAAGLMISLLAIVSLIFATLFLLRIVMIMFLTILSPFAWICSVLPVTQKYSQQWWSTFGRYVALGPLLAFFVWLALYIGSGQGGGVIEGLSANIGTSPASGAVGKALDPSVVANFILAIIMLYAGLKFAAEMSNEFAKITGAVGNIGKIAAGVTLAMGMFKLATKAPKGLAMWVGKRWAPLRRTKWRLAEKLHHLAYPEEKGKKGNILAKAASWFIQTGAREEYWKDELEKRARLFHAREREKIQPGIPWHERELEAQIHEEMRRMGSMDASQFTVHFNDIMSQLEKDPANRTLQRQALALIWYLNNTYADDGQGADFFKEFMDTHYIDKKTGRIIRQKEDIAKKSKEIRERQERGERLTEDERKYLRDHTLWTHDKDGNREERSNENLRRFLDGMSTVGGLKHIRQEVADILLRSTAAAISSKRFDGVLTSVDPKTGKAAFPDQELMNTAIRRNHTKITGFPDESWQPFTKTIRTADGRKALVIDPDFAEEWIAARAIPYQYLTRMQARTITEALSIYMKKTPEGKYGFDIPQEAVGGCLKPWLEKAGESFIFALQKLTGKADLENLDFTVAGKRCTDFKDFLSKVGVTDPKDQKDMLTAYSTLGKRGARQGAPEEAAPELGPGGQPQISTGEDIAKFLSSMLSLPESVKQIVQELEQIKGVEKDEAAKLEYVKIHLQERLLLFGNNQQKVNNVLKKIENMEQVEDFLEHLRYLGKEKSKK